MTLKAEMTESSVVPLAPAGNGGQRTGQRHRDDIGSAAVVYVVRWGLFGCSAWHVEELSDVIAVFSAPG